MEKVGMDLHFFMEKKGDPDAEDPAEEEMEVDDTKPEDPYFCKVCDATVKEGSKKHDKSQLHTLRKRYWERQLAKQKCDETFQSKGLEALVGVETIPMSKPNLECTKWWGVAKQPFVGIEYIFEIQPYNVRVSKERRFYACRLCGESNMPVFTHLISIAHRVNYMIEHYEGIQPYLDKERTNGELLRDLVEKKGYPIYRPAYSGTRINLILSGFCAELKNKYIKVNKNMQGHQAIGPVPYKMYRQPCLFDQIQGQLKFIHFTEYPDHLLERLWRHGSNFALYVKAPDPSEYNEDDKAILSRMMANDPTFNPYSGGPGPQPGGIGSNGNMFNNGGQRPQQAGPGPMGDNGMAPMQQGAGPQQAPKITLLAWMHKTAQKLDAEPVQATEFEMLQRVMDLLKCGVKVYMANPSPKDICFYPEKLGNPDRMLLKEWLQLSINYFEESWLCSDREVNMARVLVEQIDNARKRYLEAKSRPAPLTMGQAASKITMGQAAANMPPGGDFADFNNPECQQALFNGLASVLANVDQGGFDNGGRGGFNNGRGRFNGPPGRFDGPPGGFDGPPGRFDGPPGRFDGPPGGFDGPPGRFDGPPDGFRGGRGGFRGRGGRGGFRPY